MVMKTITVIRVSEGKVLQQRPNILVYFGQIIIIYMIRGDTLLLSITYLHIANKVTYLLIDHFVS